MNLIYVVIGVKLNFVPSGHFMGSQAQLKVGTFRRNVLCFTGNYKKTKIICYLINSYRINNLLKKSPATSSGTIYLYRLHECIYRQINNHHYLSQAAITLVGNGSKRIGIYN